MILSPEGGLRRTDYVVLATLCAALYGWAAFAGRPMSIHEARVPQLAREMVQGRSDWLLPHSGGRPWLERPPLPHWFVAGSMWLFGRTDAEWVARVPSALAGCAIVMMGAWMAGSGFGRRLGLLSGVVLATTFELYQYASLAEDDIYLGALATACACFFVKAESAPLPLASSGERGRARAWLVEWFTWRPWPVVALFFLLGLTNLAKGPLVGAMPVVGAIGAYFLWNRDVHGARRYLWFWGWLIFAALTAAWPAWALRHYPDVWDNWMFDYAGRSELGGGDQWNEPFWYYLEKLPTALAPWTWATVIGVIATARPVWEARHGALRFVWCWAWVGLLVLSLPARKHHHYLVPLVTPWAILGALGLREVGRWMFAKAKTSGSEEKPWLGVLIVGIPGAVAIGLMHEKLPGPVGAAVLLGAAWLLCVGLFTLGQARRSRELLVGAALLGVVAIAGYVQTYVAGRDPRTQGAMLFLDQVEAAVPPGQPLLINAGVGSLEFFRLQFYSRDDARLLHNLSFLRDRNLTAPEVYVVTRAGDEEKLRRLGELQVVCQSPSRRPNEPASQRFTLLRLRFRPDLERFEPPSRIGVMQAMERKRGPWCGEPM